MFKKLILLISRHTSSDFNSKTEVILCMGRNHLMVNGFVVASETDLCRDPDLRRIFQSDVWTKEMLEWAAY